MEESFDAVIVGAGFAGLYMTCCTGCAGWA